MYADTIEYSPISRICVVGSASYRPTALLGIATLFDLLLLVLTASKAMKTPSLKSNSIVRVKSWMSPCGIDPEEKPRSYLLWYGTSSCT